MKPILFSPTETAFLTNGIGFLSDAISCHPVQEINGKYELEIKYPIMGLHFSSIQQRSIIQAKVDPVSDLQPFRVYQVTKTSSDVVTVRARHLAYDLGGIPVSPFAAESVGTALAGLSMNAATDCPFTFFTDKHTPAAFSVKIPSPIWSLLGGSKGGILDIYGGEYEFDGYDVKLLSRRGADRGVSIRYGKNLTSLEQDENCANCYTGIYPYWKNAEGTLVLLLEKIVNAPGTYNYVKIKPVDFSAEWQEPPTQEQLRARAEKYITDNDIGKPTVSWKVEFVQLEQTEEYKGRALLERVLLGDTVSVEFEEMGVSATARVVAVDYDSILERYNSVTLGSVKANIADTIATQQQKIQETPTKNDLNSAQEAATAWLTNGKGYKVERRDANGNTIDTLYLDTPDINTAVNVLRVGQSGIGFSRSGVNGPYYSAWTIDGHFNADFITTGAIHSNDDTITIDLTNNKIVINAKDSSRSDERIELSNQGFRGFGFNGLTKLFEETISIKPGSIIDATSQLYSTIQSTSGVGLAILVSAGKTLLLGDGGARVSIQGKNASWKSNGDGTYTLIGQ